LDLALALAFALLGSLGAVLGAAGILLAQTRSRALLPVLISYATGTLLGGAFLGMIPEALDRESGIMVPAALLAGILLFFFLEKMVLWRHCHEEECEIHAASGELILIGDAVHNLIDGVVIGAAFAESTSLGIAAAVAVIAHEVPQEVGDFAILLDSGFRRARALAYNAGSSLTTLPAALIAYISFSALEGAIPVVLSIAAASFIYIALADLVPGLHRVQELRGLPRQLIPILAGVGTIVLVRTIS
jgi:zinc and cadmium transporter